MQRNFKGDRIVFVEEGGEEAEEIKHPRGRRTGNTSHESERGSKGAALNFIL
jgi:hypothetical protein